MPGDKPETVAGPDERDGKDFLRTWRACGVDMGKRQTQGYIDACLECRRLDLQARSAVLELTLLEAARRLNRADPLECDRFEVLIEEAREEQRRSQFALWGHVREHSARESRALVSEYVN